MIDPRVREALLEATHEHDQPQTVGDRIIAWLEALSNGNTSFDQRDETSRRCKSIYDAVQISDESLEVEDDL